MSTMARTTWLCLVLRDVTGSWRMLIVAPRT
jgi:hypothetical protein